MAGLFEKARSEIGSPAQADETGHITRPPGSTLLPPPIGERRLCYLEIYFVSPETVDRIRASWIGALVEQYVRWLSAQGYGARTLLRLLPQLVTFGEFARERG